MNNINKKNKILDIKNLSIITKVDDYNMINPVVDISMQAYSNEIIAVIGSKNSGKVVLGKAIAGEISFNALTLAVDNKNVINFMDSSKNKNRPVFIKSKNVNLISDKKLKDFSFLITPLKYYTQQLKENKIDEVETLVNKIFLDISYLTKLVNAKKTDNEKDLIDVIFEFNDLKKSFSSLIENIYSLQFNNKEELNRVEKKYIYALEKINEKILLLRSNYNLATKKNYEKIVSEFNSKFYETKLKIDFIDFKKESILKKLQEELNDTKKEMSSDYADLHRSHLKERKSFVEKNFNDEKNKYLGEFLKQKNILLENNDQEKKDYKQKLKTHKKLVKTQVKIKLNSEMINLQDEYRITLKEFIYKKNEISQQLKKQSSPENESKNLNTKDIIIKLKKLLNKLNVITKNLIPILNTAIKQETNYLVLKSKYDPIILEWKILGEIYKTKKTKLNSKKAKFIAKKILQMMDISEKEMNMPINKLSIFAKIRIIVGNSILLNQKLIVLNDDIFTNVPPLDKNRLAVFIKKIKNVYELSIMMLSKNWFYVSQFADRVYILLNGVIVEYGHAHEVIANPIHPYTKALCKTIIKLEEIVENKTFKYYDNSIEEIKDNSFVKLNQIDNKNHFVLANKKELEAWTKPSKED